MVVVPVDYGLVDLLGVRLEERELDEIEVLVLGLLGNPEVVDIVP